MTEPMVSVRVFRRVVRAASLGYFLLVGVIAFAFWLVNQQQAEATRQREALRQVVRQQQINDCGSTAHGTAGDLIFTDVLIEAAQANGDQTTDEKRRTETFRRAINERLLGALPKICEGVMDLREYRERVDREAHPPPATGGVSLG